MKKTYFFLLITSFMLLTGCSDAAGLLGAPALVRNSINSRLSDLESQTTTNAEQRRITVTGSSQVMVIPDEVLLTLGVETWDKELAKAREANDEIVKRVLEIAREMRIDAKYIQTDYIQIEPRYKDSYEQKDFIGYFVRKNIVITLKDLDKFEELYSRALEAGVNYVHGVQFQTTELRKYRDQARALAVQAAREKAIAMAGELDRRIGEPMSILENSNYWWSGYSSWWGYSGAGAYQNVIQSANQAPPDIQGTLAPGQIAVTATVTVEFELK